MGFGSFKELAGDKELERTSTANLLKESVVGADIGSGRNLGGLFGSGGGLTGPTGFMSGVSSAIGASNPYVGAALLAAKVGRMGADAKTKRYVKEKKDEMFENRMAMMENKMTSQDFASRRGAAAQDAQRMRSVRPFTSMLESVGTLDA